jgi:polyhydroxyalkanoate synthase
LYWNSDSTNLPGAMFVYYVRNTYLENNLRVPGKLTMCGAPVDLGAITLPAYILATREDHIVPWKTAYQSTQLLNGEIKFVLAASGHIAGVINPAEKNRRNYWTGNTIPPDAGEWLKQAATCAGSWWPDWAAWLAERSAERVPAPARPGNSNHQAIEPAPGRYVRERCD